MDPASEAPLPPRINGKRRRDRGNAASDAPAAAAAAEQPAAAAPRVAPAAAASSSVTAAEGQPCAAGASTSAGAAASGAAAAHRREAPVAAVVYAALDAHQLRSGAVDGYQFEYLDHTADVQLHAWGPTLTHAFEQVALAMYNYMTPLEGIGIDPDCDRTFEAEGHDMESLLFAWLDELLFEFNTSFFVAKELRITSFDRQSWRIVASARGEAFDRNRHESGTEIKAMTYSAMQIREEEGDAEVFVIVDI